MTNPVGGGSEHVSRYRALGEFDNLVRAAREAKRALKELREEEAKLNAQSLADDKKVTASKNERAKAEKASADSAKKSVEDLNRTDTAGKSGEAAGASYHRGLGRGIQNGQNSSANKQFLQSAVKALEDTFAKAGESSGKQFSDKTSDSINRNLGGRLTTLNRTLSKLKLDPLVLDVDTKDAVQSIASIEFELRKLSHEDSDVEIRILSNRALSDIRAVSRSLRDEIGEEVVKDAERVRKELEKIDSLPSGKSFKFWALTALSDMSKVFEEADRGASIFERLKLAAAGGGGRGSFVGSFISGFDNLSESSSNLLQRLSRVSGELYRMPGLIGVLVSAIPGLIAGIGALGGAALGVSSSIGAIGGTLFALPGLGAAALSTVGALTSSFGGLSDVLKEAKKAQADELYAREEARLGTNKALTPLQKYKALINDLLPATQTVTLAIVDFADAWTNLAERVGERFFKEVDSDVGRLTTVLDIAENFLGKTATALGKVASEGLKMITSGPWKRDFKTIAENNVKVVENFGGAGLELADAFRNIAIEAGPFNTWLTKAIKEGAEAFADWSANARSDGSIRQFLEETQTSLQSIWQIIKNLGSVVSSFYKASIGEGQRYMQSLEDITGHWADVAEAQEAANSPLRKWLEQIRPVLSALGDLIADVARGIGGLSSNQNNIQTMIDLLDSLRTDVLPPILSILQHLNDSGIAVTVTRALGDMLDAIATFLDSGATQALTVFVTVLAEFFQLLFNIASLPGVSDVLGGVAAGLAAVAAVSVVARFTGLFRLWDFFTWMTRNRGNLSGAFADAARGVAGLEPRNQTSRVAPVNVPSTISVGPVGSEVIGTTARNVDRVGDAARTATPSVSLFSRAVGGISGAGTAARTALSGIVGFLGGPWGVALTVATVGVGLLANHLADQKKEAEDTKNAFIALKNAYGDLSKGNTDQVSQLAATDEKFKDIAENAKRFNVSLTDVSGALNNNDQNLSRVNAQLDSQIATYERLRVAALDAGGPTAAIPYKKLKDDAIEFKDSINEVANAQGKSNDITRDTIGLARTYEDRLGGMTQAQVDAAVQAGELDGKINLLSGALDTLASATSTNSDRSKALSDLINYETGTMEKAYEASENWNSSLLTLSESAEVNGKSLSEQTRQGLRNRDALEAAAKATRDLYLEDIAAGVPMDEALKRHKDRITQLDKEAGKTFDNKEAVKDLIKTYGDIPDSIKTDIQKDEKGFEAVFIELTKLQIIQKALQEGKSLSQASSAWQAESGKFYQRYIPGVNGPKNDGYGAPGFASGGAVWGAGTKTSDSIRAWLSNGEFVQPADAVEHYGMPIMEALRTKKLDRVAIQEALPSDNNATFASGGPAHSANCVSCSSGGHKFASGGNVRVPISVNPVNTLIDKNWVDSVGDLGSGGGGKGWQWQMRVLRAAFPGLPLISGYRPGARTLSGNRSYHSLGRAVDLPPRRDVALWIRNNYGANTKELITPYNDLNLHNGKPHRYTGAIWNQHNFAGGNAHDHWAFNQGGLVDLMNMMNMNNLAPNQNTSLPTSPRSLSSAASSVVNNSTDNTRTFGDVIINNPAPERAGDSIRDALYRTTLLY